MKKDHSNMHNMIEDHYRKLWIMALLAFVSMYILMYSMVNSLGNMFNNVNQFYMAGLMTAPMIPIEMLLMRSMYKDQKRNLLIVIASILAGLLFFFLIRQQSSVANKQFLRSMIPHHADAILMCEQASIQDAEIQELCKTIISSCTNSSSRAPKIPYGCYERMVQNSPSKRQAILYETGMCFIFGDVKATAKSCPHARGYFRLA